MPGDLKAKCSEMYARDGGSTIVCRTCGETKPLFTASCSGSIEEPTIWNCGDCSSKKGKNNEAEK